MERKGTYLSWPHIDVSALANLVKQLPTKTVCDGLLRSFMISVRPVFPIIHRHSFIKSYENFFRFQMEDPDHVVSDDNLLDDPTQLSTIFAVLSCGARAAPPEFWNHQDMQSVDAIEIINRLTTISNNSIAASRGTSHPTLHTLTALVLGESCTVPQTAELGDSALIVMMAKIAQAMGLHRDHTNSGLDAITAELRRRLWWHVLFLDLHLSITLGSGTLAGLDTSDVNMVRDLRDEDLSAEAKDADPLLLPCGSSPPSTLFMLARFESVRTLRPIAEFAHRGQSCVQEQLDRFNYTMKMLHSRIDDLISRIPAKGIPEKGNISVRIATASPDTHPHLYAEDSREPSVLGCWARIMMHLLKLDSSLLLLKVAVAEVDKHSDEAQQLWTK
jgi:hypothetical protein